MVTSRLLQACYDKSPNLTELQNSSNLVIESHTQDTHDWSKFANNVLAKTRADTVL
jgi:hypothetical protein